jgi:anti-anti-sigma factor
LSLATREVGRVTIVHCSGRIVAGSASDSLREHVTWLLRDRRSIILHLGEVGFIDSSGLGTMVRALTTPRLQLSAQTWRLLTSYYRAGKFAEAEASYQALTEE